MGNLIKGLGNSRIWKKSKLFFAPKIPRHPRNYVPKYYGGTKYVSTHNGHYGYENWPKPL